MCSFWLPRSPCAVLFQEDTPSPEVERLLALAVGTFCHLGASICAFVPCTQYKTQRRHLQQSSRALCSRPVFLLARSSTVCCPAAGLFRLEFSQQPCCCSTASSTTLKIPLLHEQQIRHKKREQENADHQSKTYLEHSCQPEPPALCHPASSG